ncbi:hypothetical protein [Sulfitobacter mediterraneus]|uniref:hypothetical protein n=1 Tax=Sulfitobacter mediterraneus TaxID=83219 RepID=UPI0004688C5B|nr:hypothetical protein [Sulfitobacter mediterraneus]
MASKLFTAAQLHQTGRWCISQYFNMLKEQCADFAVVVLTQKKVMADPSNRSTEILAAQRFSPNQPFKRIEYGGT